MSRVRVLGLLAAVVLIAVASLLLARGGAETERAAAACPAGQLRVPDREEGQSSVLIGGPVKSEANREERERERERERDKDKGDKGELGDYESNFKGDCPPAGPPESSRDLAKFDEYAGTRQGADSPEQFQKALKQRDRLEAHAAASGI